MDHEDAPRRLERVADIDAGAAPYVDRLIRRVHRDGRVRVVGDTLSIDCLAVPGPAPVQQPPVLQSTILQLVHRGASAAEVAGVLHLNLSAVSAHLGQARRWYGTSSTARAVTRALEAGDIS